MKSNGASAMDPTGDNKEANKFFLKTILTFAKDLLTVRVLRLSMPKLLLK